ncbi:MAG: NAD-dependent DNA ligase LigA, partial [Mycoplasma sp.]
MKKEIENRVKELTELLNRWSFEYYSSNESSVSDAVFDQHLNELIKIETENPELKLPNSPTSRVGGIVNEKFNKINHVHPMLSLENAFNHQDIVKFMNNVYVESNNEVDFVIEPKIDGLSISVIYENSELKYAVTRGDGITGEEVTTNVRTIKDIPLFIDEKYKDLIIEVRGEIYIDINDFQEINKNLDKKFSNPRNAASGSVRNLDSSVAANRKLKAFMYNIPNPQVLGLKTQTECLDWLNQNNFKVSNLIKTFKSSTDIFNYIDEITTKRETLNYEIDGLVMKLNQIQYYDNLGSTSKYPKWAVAYKFPANIVATKILDIELNVGRTGKISYIAKLEPILLDGSLISYATLHNFEFIKTKNIKINSTIEIYKAGDVIPYVKNVVEKNEDKDLQEFPEPTNCPSCGTKLTRLDGIQDIFCVNKLCKEKIKRNIEYFVSRKIMNIEGMSYAIISKLFDNDIIASEWDLYKLKNKKEQVFNLDINIKEKSFSNLVNAIEKSKEVSLERLVASLAIKNIGYSTAKILAKKYKTLEKLSQATYEELIAIHIIGEITANDILEYFSNEEWNNTYQKIKESGINTLLIEDKSDDYEQLKEISQKTEYEKYKNKVIVITGSFSISRDKIKNILEDIYNCKVTNSVTKKTNYLLAGKDG